MSPRDILVEFAAVEERDVSPDAGSGESRLWERGLDPWSRYGIDTVRLVQVFTSRVRLRTYSLPP
jgi:hypothetical protein